MDREGNRDKAYGHSLIHKKVSLLNFKVVLECICSFRKFLPNSVTELPSSTEIIN
jgi:hypothetical protein